MISAGYFTLQAPPSMPSSPIPVLMPHSYTAQAALLPSPGVSPIRLRAAAHLYGIETIPLAQARVLEIDCGVGQHLLSFALAHPEATAIGLCFSDVEAQAAMDLAQQAGASNIQFAPIELAQIDASLGEFDYVIAHGLYETLGPEATTFLLQTCESLLSPLGLLCVDYPIYPGAKASEVVRDAMLMHCHDNEDPSTLTAQAQAALALFEEGVAHTNPMASALNQAAAAFRVQLQHKGPHATLGAQGTPCYFLEFASQTLQAGLTCVGDAQPTHDIASHWGHNVKLPNSLLSLGQTNVMRLQYLDLATGRARRHTLLIKASRNVGLRDQPMLERLDDLRWAGGWERTSWAPSDTNGRADYGDHRGRRWASPNATCSAILDALGLVWPTTLSFQDLIDVVSAIQNEPTEATTASDPIEVARSALRVMFDADILHYSLDNGPYDALQNETAQCIPGLIQAVQSTESTEGNHLTWPVINLWHEPIANIFGTFGLDRLPRLSTGVQADQFVAAARPDVDSRASSPGLREISGELGAGLLSQLKASAALHISRSAWMDLIAVVMSRSAGQSPCWSLYLAAMHALRATDQDKSAVDHKLTPQQRDQIRHLQKLTDQLDYAAAEPVARQLIERLPRHIAGPTALVRCLSNTGRHHEALALLQSMLHMHGNNLEYVQLLAATLSLLHEPIEAVRIGRMALAQNPKSSSTLNAMGLACRLNNRLQAAESYFKQAIAIDSLSYTAKANLASIMTKQGRVQQGLALCQELLNEKAAVPRGYRSVLYDTQLFLANYDSTRNAEEIFQDYRRFEDEICRPLYTKWRSHKNNRNPNRRLRIGYVSADFRSHAVNRFLMPVFEHHDRSAFEIYAYSSVTNEDSTTATYRTLADAWVPINHISDDRVAAKIRADEIDILVDLSGHTGGNRLMVFAQKPAPISISWLGYGYTTGVSAIDYFLGNAALCPEGFDHLFAETPWRLPRASATYQPSWDEMGDPGPLPALSEGHITLVCLSRSIRINDKVISVWADILHALPDARLVINSEDYSDQATCKTLLAQFSRYDVKPERITLGYSSPPWDTLKRTDIGLDCFPHSAGTTLLDMLCMGVPYVTLADRPSVGRIGAAGLYATGHPEWIAHSEQEYVDKVVALSQDINKLIKIRQTLPEDVKNCPITDEPEFTRDLETAYHEMFKKWTDSKI